MTNSSDVSTAPRPADGLARSRPKYTALLLGPGLPVNVPVPVPVPATSASTTTFTLPLDADGRFGSGEIGAHRRTLAGVQGQRGRLRLAGGRKREDDRVRARLDRDARRGAAARDTVYGDVRAVTEKHEVRTVGGVRACGCGRGRARVSACGRGGARARDGGRDRRRRRARRGKRLALPSRSRRAPSEIGRAA